jgi:hypothetical protein
VRVHQKSTARRRRRGTHVEVFWIEGVGEDAAVERPLVAVEADEAVALELAHDGVRLVAVEGVGAREEDLPHQLRLRHRQPRRRPEPDQERRPCTDTHHHVTSISQTDPYMDHDLDRRPRLAKKNTETN